MGIDRVYTTHVNICRTFEIHVPHFYENFFRQVETVGDKYMAVSGLPELCKEQARCIGRLALDMMDLSMDVSVDGISVVQSSDVFSNISLLIFLFLFIIVLFVFLPVLSLYKVARLPRSPPVDRRRSAAVVRSLIRAGTRLIYL